MMANLFPEQEIPAKVDPYDPEPERERVRGRLTLAVTLVYGALLIVDLLAAIVASDARWLRVRDAMQTILPAMGTVVGTVVGFYFGSQKR